MTDRKRKEREAEIVRLDLQLLLHAIDNTTATCDDHHRKYEQRNARIRYYSNTYGTEALARLNELRDEARNKFWGRTQELREAAGIKDTDEVRLYGEMLSYYRDRLNEANDIGDVLCYTLDKFTDRHPEYAAEIEALIDYRENHLEDNEKCI